MARGRKRKIENMNFDEVLELKNNELKEDIYSVFLNGMADNYLNKTTPARKVIDYMAGMTDNFFIKQYNKYFG